MQAPSKTYFAVLGNFDENNKPRGKIYSTSTLAKYEFFGQIATEQLSADIQIDDLNEEEVDTLADLNQQSTQDKQEDTQYKQEAIKDKQEAIKDKQEAIKEDDLVNKPEEVKIPEATSPLFIDDSGDLKNITNYEVILDKNNEENYSNNLIEGFKKSLEEKQYNVEIMKKYNTAFGKMFDRIKDFNDVKKRNFLVNHKTFFRKLYNTKLPTDEKQSLYDILSIRSYIEKFREYNLRIDLNKYIKQVEDDETIRVPVQVLVQ